MEISVNAENIISQANQWTFAGDCTLLQWMEEIGKNLEQRATATNKNFDQLSTNLKQTGTALDNVTNSLAALQYTQFVESRCHDDDETIANVAEVPLDVENQNDQIKGADDIWQIFLKKNLEVLRKFHERYSLDLEDSDEEEATNNFIYQPKNPFNERLLPHIYGSKLWNENWHVGLCDDSNSFSGDDISEAFSETSSSPAEDNDSFASNSANLAEWASATSITNEKHKEQQPIKIQNASSLRGSQPLFPPNQESLPNAISVTSGSETSSAALATAPAGARQNEPRFDIFARVPDSPPPPPLSSSSSASSLQQQQLKSAAQSKNNIRRDSVDLIAEPKTVNPTIDSSSYMPPIKRRPVNLFDDDDFSSSFSEKVDKNTSSEAAVSHNISTSPKNSVQIIQKEQEKSHTSMVSNAQPIKIDHQINKKPPTLNLFDSPDSSPKNESLFTQVKAASTASKEKTLPRAKLSTKTLFDDDDDDDDFLAIFAAKKENISKPISNLKLFDDNIEDELQPTDEITKIQSEIIKRIDSPIKKPNLFAEVTDEKYISKNKKQEDLFTKKMQLPVNIFDDVVVRDDENASKSLTPAFQKRIDIFSSEDDDDLFKSTFGTTGKVSSVQEIVSDIRKIDAKSPQHYAQKTNENIEPIKDVPDNDFSQKSTEIKQDGSGDFIGDFSQKDKIINQIREEILKENKEIVHSNKTQLIADVPSAVKQTTESIAKPVNTAYSDLFLDEPPDDDCAFFQTLDSNVLAGTSLSAHDFEQENYEPALPKVPTEEKTVTAKETPTTSYSNLGLFSDVPPDDDLEDLSIESANKKSNEPKRIHSIFYDDFNETMEALNNRKSIETNPSLHSIFYDEPPPDDDFQALLENTAKVSEVKKTPLLDQIVDKIREPTINQEYNKPDEKISPSKSGAVSKLKIPNIHINVQALLPGATQKSQLRKSVERNKDLDSSAFSDKANTIPVISPQTELRRDAAENILVNVCKNRVRAPARRHPSTRRGRQENYRKSLVYEKENELYIVEQNNQEIKADAKSTQNEDEELNKITVQSNEEIAKDISLTTGVLKSVPKAGTKNLVTDLLDEIGKENQNVVQAVPAAKLKNKSSFTAPFLDNNDGENYDYGFLFGDMNTNKSIQETFKRKTATLFPQVAESDDVEEQKYVQTDNAQVESSIPRTKTSEDSLEGPEFNYVNKSNKELEHDAGRENNIFDKIGSLATNQQTAVKAVVTRTVSVAGGLFDSDDDDENDDFLFANKTNSSSDIFVDSSKTQNQSVKIDIENNRTQNHQSDFKIDNQSSNMPSPAKFFEVSKESEKKATSANIFGDDDDDDDTLFGSSTSKAQSQDVAKTTCSKIFDDLLVEQKFAESNQKSEEQPKKFVTTPKVSSLFGSDEEENDHNNDGSLLNALNNSAKLKTKLSKVPEKEDSKALFSDTDDDDEDLFGSKTTKATLPKSVQSNVSTAPKKPLLQSNKIKPAASTTTDNPLADLFNN